jgi:hypothetical protein
MVSRKRGGLLGKCRNSKSLNGADGVEDAAQSLAMKASRHAEGDDSE